MTIENLPGLPVTVERGRARGDARRHRAAGRRVPPGGSTRGRRPGPAVSQSLRQASQRVHVRQHPPRLVCVPRIHGGDPGHQGPLHLRGRLLPVRARDGRRLRHRRVGRSTAGLERRRGHVRILLCGSHPAAGRSDAAPVAAGHRAGLHRLAVLRRLDVQRRSAGGRLRVLLGQPAGPRLGGASHRPGRGRRPGARWARPRAGSGRCRCQSSRRCRAATPPISTTGWSTAPTTTTGNSGASTPTTAASRCRPCTSGAGGTCS